MAHKLLTFIACCCLAGPACADEIYRWVDENGRTQFSDQVPERYRNAARRVDTNPSELTETQRQDAAERAAREKEVVERASSERSVRERPAGAVMGTQNSLSQRRSDCERLQREYRESQECFAPFIIRGRDGRPYRRGAAVREEAFRYCKPVADPSLQCGAPPQYNGQ